MHGGIRWFISPPPPSPLTIFCVSQDDGVRVVPLCTGHPPGVWRLLPQHEHVVVLKALLPQHDEHAAVVSDDPTLAVHLQCWKVHYRGKHPDYRSNRHSAAYCHYRTRRFHGHYSGRPALLDLYYSGNRHNSTGITAGSRHCSTGTFGGPLLYLNTMSTL